MDLGLAGRRALVTGSSSGIGEAIVRSLSEEGCAVVVHGRHPDRAEALAADLRSAGREASGVIGDLSSADGARGVCEGALEGGPVDILVANAGPFVEHGFFDASDSDWTDAFTGNTLSAIRCIRHLVGGMRERGWGRILTVGTRGAGRPLPAMIEYSAAKSALLNATVALAQELGGSGVTANIVSPGVILTPGLERMLRERGGDDIEHAERDYAPNPMGRLGRPEDVADAVAFLASRRADYITGTTLRVDGGISGTINP